MSISVRADVVDLRSDQPRKDDVFFVDSNVWFWIGYTNASRNAQRYQVKEYPSYADQALNVGSTLYRCTLSFAELAHSVERAECRIFLKKSQGDAVSNFEMKNFRHNHPTARSAIVAEIEDIWNTTNDMTMGKTIEVNLTLSMVQQSLNRLKSEALDGYDAFMIEALITTQGITQVITDDGDFGQIAGITVFTANNTLIKAARDQNKLLKR